jgi:hypothetical protein
MLSEITFPDPSDAVVPGNQYNVAELEDVLDDNNKKRFLLYYWFAVNVFGIRGQHNRRELPRCVVAKIRELYPNPFGRLYKGYYRV